MEGGGAGVELEDGREALELALEGLFLGQLLALDSALGRNFRKFGNMHCDPRPNAAAERACAQWDATAGGAAQCGGQIVRLERTAGPDEAATAAAAAARLSEVSVSGSVAASAASIRSSCDTSSATQT